MTHWRLFGVALVLPLLFTAFVFLEVLRNRTAAGEAIELSEREVTISGGSSRNSGMTARMRWALEGEYRRGWLSPRQLASLGFDLADDPRDSEDRRVGRQLQRRAFIAFDLRAGLPGSRLVPVDASVDRAELLVRYPNRRTHLVTSGLVALRRDVASGQPAAADGYVVSIDPRELHVPPEFAERLRRRNGERPRTFTMTVRFGSQLEPWIEDVR